MQDAQRFHAWLEQFGHLLTEAMSIAKLARYFKVNRATMAQVLERMDGVQRFGSKFQVPVRRMPLRYFIDTGLLKPPETDRFC